MQTKTWTVVRNFKNGNGWESVVLAADDVGFIQQKLREFNREVMAQSLADAADLLKPFVGPHEARMVHIRELADFLASRRTLDARTAHEEFLRTKIWAARHEHANPEVV